MYLPHIILTTVLTISIANAKEPIQITTLVKAHTYTAPIREAIQTSAEHDIEIINNTDKFQSFSYLYQYCPEEEPCINTENTVSVAPNTTWNNHHQSFAWTNYFSRGYYNLKAHTIVNSHTLHSQADDTGTVSVK